MRALAAAGASSVLRIRGEHDVPDDYDSPWKEAIERYFPDFLHFYFPQAHAQIDWRVPPVFLDQELRAVVHDAELGRRFVDKLVRVTRQGGQAEWLYVHIEVQGTAGNDFAERMFVYHYRLYDRYRQPIASLAVLADDRPDWRPECFQYDACGCHLRLRFPVAKLLDWIGSEARLDDGRNPFALVTRAHLCTRATCDDAAARFSAKWHLVEGLYRRGWDRQQVVDLFRIIDWMMRLPPDMETQLQQDLQALEEERKMPYLSTMERMATENGLKQGLQQGLEQGMQQGRIAGKQQILTRVLVRRFGELPPWAAGRLLAASEPELDAWTDAALSADCLDAVLGRPAS